MVGGFRPNTLREALSIRARTAATPVAGGTDLMVKGRRPEGCVTRLAGPPLFLAHLPELRDIRQDEGSLRIGAAVTLSELLADRRAPSALRLAIARMASPAIRNVATLGGNVCNASPAGDTLPVLYCLDAALVVSRLAGEREIGIQEFIQGPGITSLATDEILTAVIIPSGTFERVYYRKVGTRQANALSKLSFLGLAAFVNGRLADVRIAFGAVAPTVVRSRVIEQRIVSASAGWPSLLQETVAEIVAEYGKLIAPIDDQRSTADYRKTVALNLLDDFLEDPSDQRI